jgi:hypothetical protein
MSSTSDVVRATCRIVGPDGRLAGTGVVVLPGGFVLTCHHVVRPMERVSVVVDEQDAARPATYLATRSAPELDLAVLRVADLPVEPVQLGGLRTGVDAYGVGFRPSELDAEPTGRVFPGRIEAGQHLRLPPPPLPNSLADLPRDELPAWARDPDEYHAGEVANFAVTGGLEQGISGGPVYDTEQRRVVGLLRAIEGTDQAFVLPVSLLEGTWPGLLVDNRVEVKDTPLDELGDRYAVGLVREGARPQRPQPWRDLAPLEDLHRRFAGRDTEMALLDRFLECSPAGYQLVTGPSGFGKSALLWNYARRLAHRGRRVALHAITARLDDALSIRAVLGRLCRQLMALHELGGDLPADDGDLRHLFADLLQFEPAGAPITVVVDGLDEALGTWQVERLFPFPLPVGVHVVMSARTIADTDWLARLGLPSEHVDTIELDRFTRGQIAALVATAIPPDHPDLDALVDRVERITGGDPFYVRDVVDDLEGRQDLSPETLQDHPVGHLQYLRGWWNEARRANPGQGFVDLMGTLAVARSPLGERELAAVATDDALTGADLPLLIDSGRRYLEGSDVAGYRLAHRRTETFVRDVLQDSIETYHDRLTAFCLREPDDTTTERARRYSLVHALDHLLEGDRVDDAVALLSSRWIARHYLETGTYRLLVDQFDQLASHCAARLDDHAAVALVPGMLLGRETAREVIGDLPPELLSAWVHLGGEEHVLTICRGLSSYRGRAAGQLLAAAGALLDRAQTGASPRYVDDASELIGRTIGMLPHVRTLAWAIDALDRLFPLLEHPVMPVPAREAEIEQLAAIATSMPSHDARAVVLGFAARASAGHPDLATRTVQLLDEVTGAMAAIDHPGDSLFVQALAAPALRRVRPDEYARIGQRLVEVVRNRVSSTVESDLLGRWLTIVHEPDDPLPAELMSHLADEVASTGDDRFSPRLVEALCEVGLGDRAVQLLRGVASDTTPNSSRTTILAAPALLRTGLASADDLVRETLAGATWDETAHGYAMLGRWPEALECLERSDTPRGGLAYVVSSIASHLHNAGSAPLVSQTASRLLQVAGDLEPSRRAEVEAVTATVLARMDPELADPWLRRAMHHGLAELPEGDSDFLHLLVATAHVQHGAYADGERVAAVAVWPHRRVQAFANLLAAGRDRPDAPLSAWAARLAGLLDEWLPRSDYFRPEALTSAVVAADVIADVVPSAAQLMCRAVERAATDPALGPPLPDTLVGLADVLWSLDREEGRRLLALAAEMVQPGDLAALRGYMHALGERRTVDPDEIDARLRDARLLVPHLDTPRLDRLEVWRTRAAYAAARAGHAPDAAVDELRPLVRRLPGLALHEDPVSDGLLGLSRLLTDMTGASLDPLPQAVAAGAAAITAVSRVRPNDAVQLARTLLSGVLTSTRSGARVHAARAYFSGLVDADVAVSGVTSWAMEAVQQHLEPEAADRVLAAAAEHLTASGRLEAAAALAERAHDASTTAELLESVTHRRAVSEVVAESPLETALLEGETAHVAPSLLTLLREVGGRAALESVLESLTEPDFRHPRIRWFDEFLPLVALPLLEVADTAALDRMLATIDDIDERFLAAAAEIAET